ncbi:methionine--tRNA ligase [Atrimonas thermophila]|uniref:methionine--tRNA ligase n=1 Tax=Atrimonas thermophila TaxID=3064161 RepID=UPI00399D24EA
MGKGSFYITTPIYYVNDVPHIGHAYTTCAADVLARYHRLLGKEVLFATGTDEHGQKIEKAALEKGVTPQELVDQVVERFLDLWKKMDISYDDFIRTTEERHIRTVEAFFSLLNEKGYIYKGDYEGWYCVPCETFWTEGQLSGELICPDCGRPLEKVREETYFFALSRLQERLLDYLERHPSFVMPESRYNEVVSFVRGGLKDQSISRTGVKWGVPVPSDPGHTFYVWFDALINYLTVAGFGSDEIKFQTFWPRVRHLVGKDILRFHAVLWPAMLLAAELPLPQMVFAHGWWTVEGEKMSKSKGNVVDPNEVIERYGVDRFRYFLMREVTFGLDGDFSEKSLIERTNADLSDNFGNLVHRTSSMAWKYLGGKVKRPSLYQDEEWEKLLAEVKSSVAFYFERFGFAQVLESIWKLVHFGNRYIDQKAPWRLSKDSEKKEELTSILYRLLDCARILAVMVYPFCPRSCGKLWKALGLGDFPDFDSWEREISWESGPEVFNLEKPAPLFPRIEN